MSLRTKIKLQNDEGVRTYEQSQKRGLGRLFAGGLAVGASLITRDIAKTTTGKVAEVVCSATATGLLGYVILDTAASLVTFPVALTKFNRKKAAAGKYFKNYDNCTGWVITTNDEGKEVRQYNPDKDNRVFLYSSNPDEQERSYQYLRADNKIAGYRDAFKDEHANLLKRIYVDYVDESDEGTFYACRRALEEAGVTPAVVKIIQDDVAKNGVVTSKSLKHIEEGALKVLDKIACWDFAQELQKNAKNEYSKFESLDHLRGSLYLTPEQIKFFDKKGQKLPRGRFFGVNKFPFTEEQYKLLVTYKGGSIKDLERIEVLRRKINAEQSKPNPSEKVISEAVAEIDDIQKRVLDNARLHRKRMRVVFTNSGSTFFPVGKRYRVLNGTIGERLQNRKARRKAAKKTTEALEASFSNNIFPITKVLSRPLAGAINYTQKRIRYGKQYAKHKQIFGHNGFEARHKGMHSADVCCDTSHRFDKIEKKYMKLGLTDIVEEGQGNISNMAVGYVKESAKKKFPGMTNGVISSIESVKARAEKRTDPMRHGTTTYLDNPVMIQVYLDGDANDKKVLPSVTLNIDHDDVIEGAILGLIEDVKNGNVKESEINNITLMAGDRKVVIYREQLKQIWEDAKKGIPLKESRLGKSIAQICTKEKFPKVIDFEEYEAWESGASASANAPANTPVDASVEGGKPVPVSPDAGLGIVSPDASADVNDAQAPAVSLEDASVNGAVEDASSVEGATVLVDGKPNSTVVPLETPVTEESRTALHDEYDKALADLDAEYDKKRDEIIAKGGSAKSISESLIELSKDREKAREDLTIKYAKMIKDEYANLAASDENSAKPDSVIPQSPKTDDVVKPVDTKGDVQLEIDVDGVLARQAEDASKDNKPKASENKPTAVVNKPKPEFPSAEVKETTREMMARTGIATKPAPAKYNRMAVDINKSRNNLYAKIERLNEDYEAAMVLLNEARESGKASEILSAKEDALEVVRELKTSYITLYNLYQANKTPQDKETIRKIDDIIEDLGDDFNRLLAIDVPVNEEEINDEANSSINAEIARIEEDLQSADELLSNATGDEKLELLKEKEHFLTMLVSLYETKSDYISDEDRETAKVGSTRKKYNAQLKLVKAEIKAIEDSKKEIAMDRPVDADDRKIAFIDRMSGLPIGKIDASQTKKDSQNSSQATKPVVTPANSKTASKKPATFVFGVRADDDDDSAKTTGGAKTSSSKKTTTQKTKKATPAVKPTKTTTKSTAVAGANSTKATTPVTNKPVVTPVLPPVKPASTTSVLDRLEKKKEAIRKKCERITKRIGDMQGKIAKLEVINSQADANNRYAFTISERERKITGAQTEIQEATKFMQEAQSIIDRIKGKTIDELTDEERKAEEAAFEEAKKTSKAMTAVNRETIGDKKEIQSAISESKQLGIKPKRSKPATGSAPGTVS